jgi:hypothetical protein
LLLLLWEVGGWDRTRDHMITDTRFSPHGYHLPNNNASNCSIQREGQKATPEKAKSLHKTATLSYERLTNDSNICYPPLYTREGGRWHWKVYFLE